MNDDEKRMAVSLGMCTFCPGIPTKRFARNMMEAARREETPVLTSKQREYLRTAVIRFRRQIDPAVVELARHA